MTMDEDWSIEHSQELVAVLMSIIHRAAELGQDVEWSVEQLPSTRGETVMRLRGVLSAPTIESQEINQVVGVVYETLPNGKCRVRFTPR